MLREIQLHDLKTWAQPMLAISLPQLQLMALWCSVESNYAAAIHDTLLHLETQDTWHCHRNSVDNSMLLESPLLGGPEA